MLFGTDFYGKNPGKNTQHLKSLFGGVPQGNYNRWSMLHGVVCGPDFLIIRGEWVVRGGGGGVYITLSHGE